MNTFIKSVTNQATTANGAVSQQPVTMTDHAVLINGYSPAICKTILSMKLDKLKEMTPMKMYLVALGTKYDFVDTIFGV